MLTKMTAYSQWANVDPLVLNIMNRPDTDLFEVRNIDGLGAVKAAINTTPYGSLNKEQFVGSQSGKRNILATIGYDPDWNDWTISKLRRLLAKTFSPNNTIRLVFESLEFSPVEISGYIESNEPNMFSKDPEQVISIICPDPDFVAIDQTQIDGESDQIPWPIEYSGDVETPMYVRVYRKPGIPSGTPDPTHVQIQSNDPDPTYIYAPGPGAAPVDATHDLYMDSTPGGKYIQRVTNTGGTPTVDNLLNDARIVPRWPVIGPGTDSFQVIVDAGIVAWTLIYKERFGSL